jgi:hypothetical protein
MNQIRVLYGGRFISHHDEQVTLFFDARHRVMKTRLEGGIMCELVQERREDGSYRDQLMVIDGQVLEMGA